MDLWDSLFAEHEERMLDGQQEVTAAEAGEKTFADVLRLVFDVEAAMAKNLRHNPNSPQKFGARERRIQVLKYRIQHASLRAIADKLGVSHQTVANDLTKALDELHQTELKEARNFRMLELQRLELASNAIIERVLQGELEAVAQYRLLSESRRKLLGLDAPTALDVRLEEATPLTDLPAQELKQTVARVLEMVEQEEADERNDD